MKISKLIRVALGYFTCPFIHRHIFWLLPGWRQWCGVMYSLLWQSGRGQEMLSGDHSPGETLSPCVQTGAISLQWPLTEAGSDQGGKGKERR